MFNVFVFIVFLFYIFFFFFSSRRRHTRFDCGWSSDVCSSDLSSPSPRSACRLRVWSALTAFCRSPTCSRAREPHSVPKRFVSFPPCCGCRATTPCCSFCARSEERRVGKGCNGRLRTDVER